MSETAIGGALLAALVIVVALMVVARRAGAIPNQDKIDRADGVFVPPFIDGGSSSSIDCGSSGADGGGACH